MNQAQINEEKKQVEKVAQATENQAKWYVNSYPNWS
ncbi:MAG: hypothetical protein KatS3mg092_0726 [Patescibacteria group bacterium]|nr:MAG: hypothetical protein KatS3mg092_0726 [Patescibacteria group bacterium]